MSKVRASDHESYNTFSIIGFLVPLIGIIIGIVYITKDTKLEKKLGEHMIAFSILGFILWTIVGQVYLSSHAVNQIQYIQL